MLLGLASRLLPHVLEVSDSLGTGPRLRYPLGYWNANGAIAGIAVAMLLWSSRGASWAWMRWLSAALIPAVLVTLYFTYSRGGLLSLIVSVGCLLALSRDRLWMLATLGFGALGALPAVLAVQDYESLANNLSVQASIAQGENVALLVLAGTALAVLLFAGLRAIENREGHWTGRLVDMSRHPGLLRGIGLALVIAVIGVAIAVGGRAWHQFSRPDLYFPTNNPSQHFSQLSGAGRYDFWRVAVEAFEEEPVAGHGAGTYQFSWEQHRRIDLDLHDAHSLYLEAFAELGTIGGLIVLALVGTMLWVGFSAWRAATHPKREAYAALFAAMLSFAVGAAFDWFWEIAGLGAVFFLAAGVLVSVRCAQLAPEASSVQGGRRYGLAIAGLATAWIAAVALVGPLLVTREITQSQNAVVTGDIGSAISHANTARSIEPWAASPYVQLGLLADLQKDYPSAIAHFGDAIQREDHNWQWYYLRSEAEHLAGDEAAAQEDLVRARHLNPRLDCLREGWTC